MEKINFALINSEEMDKETVLFKESFTSNQKLDSLLSYSNLISIYKNIFRKYNLSAFQKDVLLNIFIEFKKIQIQIDPSKILDFSHTFTEEEELCFFRNSENGLTNLIVDEDNLITFSFISKTKAHKSTLEFYEKGSYNFEKIAYSLFSL